MATHFLQFYPCRIFQIHSFPSPQPHCRCGDLGILSLAWTIEVASALLSFHLLSARSCPSADSPPHMLERNISVFPWMHSAQLFFFKLEHTGSTILQVTGVPHGDSQLERLYSIHSHGKTLPILPMQHSTAQPHSVFLYIIVCIP